MKRWMMSRSQIRLVLKEHTLTILSAVRDENAMVMELTLENPAGETALVCDRLANEAKGAYFADASEIFFGIDRAPEMIWADLENSTDTCLRLHYYCVFMEKLPDGQAPVLITACADGPVAGAPEAAVR